MEREQQRPAALTIVAGAGNPALASAVADALGQEVACDVERFPDGEISVAVRVSRGDDVYVVQPTGPPVHERLVELLLLIDACVRAGAARVTAVLPYFGYARQDRRTEPGQAIGARLVCELLGTAGASRLVVCDPHTPALEAMSPVPVETLSAVATLATAVGLQPGPAVLVAPDLGAVKLAERYAAKLGLPVAVVRKHRLSGTTVEAAAIVGDVAGRYPIVVDDMISTGGTIAAAVRLVESLGALPQVTVVATHGLLVDPAADRLGALPMRRLIVTDSVPLEDHGLPIEVCPLAPLLSRAIGRLHRDEPLDELDTP